LGELVNDKPMLEKKLHAAQSVLSCCKSWLDGLPPHAVLEPVATDVRGHTLEQVHNKLAAAQAELATLRAVPTPATDIEARIRAHVEAMARPQITGIGKGERLKVIWPGAGWDTRGPREDRAVPQAERKKRIAELEAEISELAYVEEALVADAIARGEDVQRSPSAPPQAALQVRVAEATNSSRAA
jgi:hypothetical protein